MTKSFVRTLLAVCFVAFGVEPAFAQVETFMLVPGIPGDSVAERYPDWIDVYSITQAFDPAAKAANACSLDIGKGIDSAGPRLWGAAVIGQVFNQIQIDIRKPGESPFKFYEIILTNAQIATVTTAPDQFIERLKQCF